MKIRHLLGIFSAALALAPLPALAVSRSWIGQTGSWSNPANWNPAGVPAPSDPLTFPASGNGTRVAVSVDVPAGTSVGPMTFNGNYTMNGNQLTLTGNVTASGSVIWNADVRFGAAATLSANSSSPMYFTGAVDVNGQTVTIWAARFEGALNGTGTIKAATSSVPLIFGASGNFSGSIVNSFGSVDPYYANLPNAAVTADRLRWAGTSSVYVGDVNVSNLTSGGLYNTLHTKSLRFGGGNLEVWQSSDMHSLVQVNGTVTLTGGQPLLRLSQS